MADVYVYSGAGGAGTGADWANAYTTLAAAGTAKAAGDRFFVAHDHAETQASAMTITMPGTVSSPNQIICALRTGSVPPVSADLRTTATISTTGANAMTISGHFYCYGIAFRVNAAAAGGGGALNLVNSSSNQQRYDSCSFQLLSTAAGGNVAMGTTSTSLYLKNTTMRFGNVGDQISVSRSRFEWVDTASAIDSAGSAPTTLFNFPSSAPAHVVLEGVDLSFLGAAKTLFPALGNPIDVLMKDCKLNASVTISAAQTAGSLSGGNVRLIRCDSSNNYRLEKHSYGGDQTTETTIVRTGGASDGTQAIAYKVITTANSRWSDPFTCIPITIWNNTTGSAITATVYGIWGGGAVPNKEDIWIEVDYMGTSGNPQGTLATSGNADILATAACDSDASTWGGSTTAFKMAATFTPQNKGPLTVYIRCAKASSTFYIDPKVVLS
jgi:hypothetical protein